LLNPTLCVFGLGQAELRVVQFQVAPIRQAGRGHLWEGVVIEAAIRVIREYAIVVTRGSPWRAPSPHGVSHLSEGHHLRATDDEDEVWQVCICVTALLNRLINFSPVCPADMFHVQVQHVDVLFTIPLVQQALYGAPRARTDFGVQGT